MNRIIIETNDPGQAEDVADALNRAGVKESAIEIRDVSFDE